jgi:HEAT repeat protein
MTKDPHRRSRKTAEELVTELQADPGYVARMRAKEQARRERVAFNRRAAAPLVEVLRDQGFAVDSVSDLFNQAFDYRAAVPTLIQWLPVIGNLDVKEDIVRALSVKWAKPIAAKPLIREFLDAPDEAGSLRWAIANALEVVADDSVCEEVVNLAADERYGRSRQMLALALGKMKDPRAKAPLVQMLGDEELAGHAVIGLGRMRARDTRALIEPFLEDPRAWVRKEARRALDRIGDVPPT